MSDNILVEVSANSRRAKKILAELLKACEDRWAFLVGYELKGDKLRILGEYSVIKGGVFREVTAKHTKRQLSFLTWRILD
jgi:hypothetical protein